MAQMLSARVALGYSIVNEQSRRKMTPGDSVHNYIIPGKGRLSDFLGRDIGIEVER
ncbi:MAG TPA: hypothetical protein VMP01_22450 [Pirellulaceae bacterium]|nr:hypothetical protein [Pirellulaceae bacterium]